MNTSNAKSPDHPLDHSGAPDEQNEHSQSLDIDSAFEEYVSSKKADLEYLQKSYQNYSIVMLAIAILAVGIVIVSTILLTNGAIPAITHGRLIFISILLGIILLVIVLSGLRPAKRGIRSLEKLLDEAASIEALDAESDQDVLDNSFLSDQVDKRVTEMNQDGETADGKPQDAVSNLAQKSSMDNMDNFFRIFERGIRNELVPLWPEYKKLRRTFVLLIILAVVVALSAMTLYALRPGSVIVSTCALIVAYIVLIVAIYIDRKKLKPMRVAWAHEKYHMSEFEARHSTKLSDE